jgi:hypothetical protein
MFAPKPEYLNARQRITIIFDCGNRKQRQLLRALQGAFGEHHSEVEALYPPRHFCLQLYPGGALELAA